MVPGASSKFGDLILLMFEPEMFWKQFHYTVLQKVLVTLLELFGAPCSDLAAPQ